MKVYLDMVGCRLNQAEIERYARQLRAAGHTLVADPSQADLAIVNTCAVTSAAVSDSRQKIRQARRAEAGSILITGCWSTLQPQEVAALLEATKDGSPRPIPWQVVANSEKDNLVNDALLRGDLEAKREGNQSLEHDLGRDYDIHLPHSDCRNTHQEGTEPPAREPIPGERLRTRAFIKVQDGCNNHCTFCVTRLARGAGRSQPIQAVLEDIRSVAGAQEVVLTGVHLGSWGHDLEPATDLKTLVRAILEDSDIPRLRLSSLEPWDLDEEFFCLWENPRLCRHLHLPLQSGCAATLRRMARKIEPRTFERVVQTAREAIPEVAITTDLIAGFPGEDEAEFEESLAFVRQMEFAGGHVFTYSRRPGTAARSMSPQVPHAISKERNARLRQALTESGRTYQEDFAGQMLPVLWESASAHNSHGYVMSGLTDNYLRVHAQAARDLWNQITPARLTRLEGDHFEGEIVAATYVATTR
jgi:threonylcarbamoyladenosine tRNA methylthiotransferase MtaB